jgi:hypothetical protein
MTISLRYLLVWLDKRIIPDDILDDPHVRYDILKKLVAPSVHKNAHPEEVTECEYHEKRDELRDRFLLLLNCLYISGTIDCHDIGFQFTHIIIKYLRANHPEMVITTIQDDEVPNIDNVINLKGNSDFTAFFSKKILNFKVFDKTI